MKTIVIIPISYSFSTRHVFHEFKTYASQEFLDLDVNYEFTYIEPGQIKTKLQGPDEEVATNFIKTNFISRTLINTLNTGEIKQGACVQVGKYGFGLFVNIGIIDPQKKDVLLPLFALREQLVKNQKLSLRPIISRFGLIDGFPIPVYVSSINDNEQIFVKLADTQIEKYNEWIKRGLDRLFICGTTSSIIFKVIREINQYDDILSVDRLGLFEFALIFKEDTSAKGMLPIIGKKISSKMAIFSPKNFVNGFNDPS